VDVGFTETKIPILVNAYYRKSDVKITLSGLKAHGTPAYSGGSLQRRELDNPHFPPEIVAVNQYAGMQHGPAVLDLPEGV